MCLENEERYKIWRGIYFAVSKLTNFDPTTRESQKLHFNGLFFTKVYNAWGKRVQRSYIWWHWRLIENLKEIDLCSQNGHEEFGKVSQAEKQQFYFKKEIAELNQKKKKKKKNQNKRINQETLFYFRNKLVAQCTINKTFCTCSTESLFLRYKKISKKAVKLGSFLQCSVHIFLGHDGCFWKIYLRILWNHIMKNIHVKHGQCDSIIFPQKFSFESTK